MDSKVNAWYFLKDMVGLDVLGEGCEFAPRGGGGDHSEGGTYDLLNSLAFRIEGDFG